MLLKLRPPCNLIFAQHRNLFSNRLLKLNLNKPYSNSYFTISIPSPKPFFLSTRTMSSSSGPRSAFEVLMSSAAKRKKPQQQQPSPKKHKVQDSKTTGSQNPTPLAKDPENAVQDDSETANSRGVDDALVVKGPEIEGVHIEDGTKNVKTKEETVDSGKKDEALGVSITPDESVRELKKKPVNFDPKKAAFWGKGEKVPFMFVAKGLDAISKETGRIVITDIACNMLRTVIDSAPQDLLAVIYLFSNKIAPAHEGLELGIGDASIIKALAEACGAKPTHIKKQYEELGDLGEVAQACRSSQSLMRKPQALTVAKVFDTFRLIAKESGKDSQEKKKNHIKALIVAATDCEPQYLIRLLQTKLRTGLAEKTLLVALGQAAFYARKQSPPPANVDSPSEEAGKIVKKVYSIIPVYDRIVPALLAGDVWDLPKTCSFSPGIPVGPMLAKAAKAVSEIVDKFQGTEFTCEYKYDGERAQIHYMENDSVEIYSRNAERNTGKFIDVAHAISSFKRPSVTSFVLDCELVAYDRQKNKILPFQVLSTRARKNVVKDDIKVDVCIYAFDILYLNGQPLLQEQLVIRREHLYKSFEEKPGFFQFATAIISNDLEEIQRFLQAAVDYSCEGLIIKTLNKDATYEPSNRSQNWLKLKKDYMDSIGDSLDLVPIAAFHGRGKRTGVYGAFLLACYDSSNEEYQSICKIGTGFTEAMLEERSASLRSKVIPKPKSYYRFSDTINPDVWFEPTEVWEVKAADLTISPVHRAAMGIVDSDKGISLRFPRLLRVREDKVPEEATSSEIVADMYNSQKSSQKNAQSNQDDNEDE